MRHIRSVLNDTLVIGSITVFSYFLYLLSEKGFLSAFGLASEGLIPLQPQSIIPSIFYSLGASFSLSSISLILSWLVLARLKNAWADIFALYTSVFVMFLPVAIMLASIDILWLIIYMTVLIIEPIVIKKWRRLDSLNHHARNYFTQRKVSDRLAQISLASGIIVIFILPAYAYAFGYLRAVSSNNIRVVNQDNKQFVIVKQYEDKLVLVQTKGLALIPKYKIQYLSSGSSLEVELTKGRLDFEEVQKYRRNGIL